MDSKNEYADKRTLKTISAAIGGAIIGFYLIQQIFGLLLAVPAVNSLYYSDKIFGECMSLLIPLVSISVPFLIAGHFLQGKTEYDLIPLGKPDGTAKTLLAIPSGVALCLIGSYVTGFLNSLLQDAGAELSAPDLSVPEKSAFATVIYIVRLTLSAALVEEICIRGVVMQSLRRYGDCFAIVMSAMIFGLMHANLIQAPFAFIAGAVIGYFTIATGSVWTGIIIHLFNNGISGLAGLFSKAFDENTANVLSASLIYFALVFGLICFVIFGFKYSKTRLHRNESDMSAAKRAGTYIFTPPMILALVLILWQMHYFISL